MSSPAAPRPAPLTGARIGRYLLGERLGTGGAASVYLALLRGPHDFERVLAVKVIHEHLTELQHFVTMFTDEANLAVRLVHPNVVHTYELGSDEPHLFLAMEYLPGQPLSSLLVRIRERGEALPPSLVAHIGARAAEGLAYAHSLCDDAGSPLRLVHRDVSPQNVFLTYDGRILVIDWGIARAEGRSTQTGLGRLKGKLAYMAPEQLLRQPVDHRADLFSLGATLYEAATGSRPFDADDEAQAIAMMLEEKAPALSTRIPDFPEDLGAVILRALEQEPDARQADCTELARGLDRAAPTVAGLAGAAELSAILHRLFGEEREEASARVARLKAGRFPRPIVEPFGASTTADPMAATIRPALGAGTSRRALFVGAAVAVALAASAMSFVAGPHRESTGGAAAAPLASVVAVDVRVEPPVDAAIRIAGNLTRGSSATVAVPRSTAPVEIEVIARGFEPIHATLLPDRDQVFAVKLAQAPAPAAAPPEPGATPAPPPAPPAVRVEHPARTAREAPDTPTQTKKAAPKDALVTEYPF